MAAAVELVGQVSLVRLEALLVTEASGQMLTQHGRLQRQQEILATTQEEAAAAHTPPLQILVMVAQAAAAMAAL